MKMKTDRNIKRGMILGVIIGGAAGILITFAAAKNTIADKEAAADLSQQSLMEENDDLKKQLKMKKGLMGAATLSTDPVEDWELILVNEYYPLDPNYVPELTEIAPDKYVDSRIAEATSAMLNDAADAGMNLYVVSAYRSYDEQWEVFDASMADRINNGGMRYLESYEDTKESVAVPGYSEHATGLALDICAADYVELDDTQAETKEAQWLAENCVNYGFVVRYPLDKSDITKIVYEPWHFRYVGKEVAKEMTEKHLTLEEYLGAI